MSLSRFKSLILGLYRMQSSQPCLVVLLLMREFAVCQAHFDEEIRDLNVLSNESDPVRAFQELSSPLGMDACYTSLPWVEDRAASYYSTKTAESAYQPSELVASPLLLRLLEIDAEQ